jgi:Mg2+ and Co2+ transporter CorA
MWLETIVVIICFAFGFAMGYMYYKYKGAERRVDKLDRKVNLFTDETRMLFGLIKKDIDCMKSDIEKIKTHVAELDATILKRKDLEGVWKIIMSRGDQANGYN